MLQTANIFTDLVSDIKSMLGKKEKEVRTIHGYNVELFNEFHRLNEVVRSVEKQIDELEHDSDYCESLTLELLSKKYQRDIIFKKLKNDYYVEKNIKEYSVTK